MRFCLVLLLCMVAVRAEDWKTTDGTVYQKVKVLSHDDTFVTIMYADGGARVPLRLLSPDLQAKFGYDAKKAAAREAATAQKEAADRAALAAQQRAAAAAAVAAASASAPAPGGAAPSSLPAAASAPARARPFDGGLIHNGDFSAGVTGWPGEGMAARAYVQMTHRPVDPEMARGLLIPLNPHSWTHIYQNIGGDPGTNYTFKITFRLAAGTVFSKDPHDYEDVNRQFHLGKIEKCPSMNIPVNAFYGVIGDFDTTDIAMVTFFPALNTTLLQHESVSFPAIPQIGDKIFILAFPPGNGMVAMMTINLSSSIRPTAP